MPEFRFRRKKQQNRRKTVHDPEETAKQLEVAKSMKKPDKAKAEKRNSIGPINPSSQEVGVAPEPGGHTRQRSSLIQEREKFFELLRSKYPEQASNLEMMTNGEGEKEVATNGHDSEVLDPPISFQVPDDIMKSASVSDLPSYRTEQQSVATSFSECLFLRYGKSIRQCPMPSPITLSTVKNLYRNLFDLGDDLLDSPDSALYVRGRGTRDWQKLEKISMVVDHCTLLLLDPGHTLNHTPSPPMDSDINTPLDLSSSHATQESHSSQPLLSVEGKTEGPPTTGMGLKRNGLWRAGRTKEVEDLTQVPDNLPIHKTASLSSPLSLTSSTSGVYSEPSIDAKKVSERTRLLQSSVNKIKVELKKLRSDHLSKLDDFSLTLNEASNQITAALRAFVKVGNVGSAGEEFRRERIELYRDEESYEKFSKETLSELKLLETAVEDMRVDVVDRRCGVEEQEVDALSHAVTTVTKAVERLQAQYEPLEDKMKRVMEYELQTVVKEERFLQAEGPRVTEAVESCTKLEQTLGVLTQFANVQSHRTPLVPYFPAVENPDRRLLLSNIEAVIPNHTHRVECLSRAEAILRRKKQLHSPTKAKLREFETQLRIQRDHLRHVEVTTLEKRREMKMKASFMEERYKMEKEIERELENERKIAAQKREQRKKQMEELWRWQQRAKTGDEKARQMRSIQQTMQGTNSSSGSNKSIPTSEGVAQDALRGGHLAPAHHHTRASSDDQTTPYISLSQSNEPTPSMQLMPPPKGKRFRKKDHLQPWQRKSIGYVGEFQNLYSSKSEELLTEQSSQQSHPLTNVKSHDSQPSNQKAVSTESHKQQPTSQVTVISSQSSNQMPPSKSHDPPPATVKPTLGPRVELSGANSNPRHQQFQTTPPFKHPNKQSHSSRPPKTVGQIRTTSSTKPMGVPSRYLNYEHSSQPDTDSQGSVSLLGRVGYKSSINSLSQPSGDEPFLRSHMQPMLPLHEGHQKRATIGATRVRGGAEVPTHPIKRSNSDDSIYESSTLERRKKQGLANAPYKVKHHGDFSPSHQRHWAMNMLNKDTLPVERRQAQLEGRHGNHMRTRNSSASSGSSGERHGSKVIGQSSHRYPQPYNMAIPRNHSDIPLHRHAPNCPAHGHAHHQGVPMRATKSAQVPTDVPLTSYPRQLAAAAHTFQLRSASNGMVQHQHRGGRMNHYPGHVTSRGSHVMSSVSHVSKRRNDDQNLGSLV